jgi:hypothetical protein
VVFEDLHASANIGEGDSDVTVETTGADEGFVERFGEVGGCNWEFTVRSSTPRRERERRRGGRG